MSPIDDLDPAQRDVLASIVTGRLAWTPVADLGAEETVLDLIAADLVARWTTRGMDVATLTPWGAWTCGVELVERVRIVGDELEEDPVWRDRPAVHPQVRLPRRAHEVRFPWMETFPDPLPGPEYLVDEESGKPVELFARLFDGEWIGGVKIVIDKRMKGGKKGSKGNKTKRRKAG